MTTDPDDLYRFVHSVYDPDIIAQRNEGEEAVVEPYEDWVTIGVTPLPPGWLSVFRDDSGHVRTEPCPALLLQESTSTVSVWDNRDHSCPDPTIRVVPPYIRCVESHQRITRVVFAVRKGDQLEPGLQEWDDYEDTMTEEALLTWTLDNATAPHP